MKKYKQKFNIAIIFITGLFMLNACSDDYLANAKVYAIDSESYFNSEADL